MKYCLFLPKLYVVAYNESATVLTISNGMGGDGDKPMSTGNAGVFHYICKFVAENQKLVIADVREIYACAASALTRDRS